MNEISSSLAKKVFSLSAFLSLLFLSCSENTENDVMNDIWENATNWNNLVDKNNSAYSNQSGKIFDGWAKKTFGNGNFYILAQFNKGQAVRILQWNESGIKRIDAGIITGAIPLQNLPIQDLELFLPFNGPVFQHIQDHWQALPLTNSFLRPISFKDFNGSVKTWYNNGCPKLISNWKDGSLEGNFTNYWNTLLVFHDPPIRIQGKVVDGKKQGKFKMNYVADSRVNKPEKITIYDLNFIAKINGTFKNNQRSGKFEFIRGNGSKSEANFQNDKKNGPSITWNKSGTKVSESLFQNGLKDGPYFEWFGNGNKKEEGSYYKGKKQGRVNFYNRDGKKLYFQTYKDGKLIIE
jgi:antitoxin component YwqK of YwqJK toxin-antitoxin module